MTVDRKIAELMMQIEELKETYCENCQEFLCEECRREWRGEE